MNNNFDDEFKQNKISSSFSFLKSLPKPQRVAFLFLSFLSLGIFILSIWQFNLRIKKPFAIPEEQESSINIDDLMASLTNLDSDNDGLTNQEELNLYNTSPYLEDSDSDGVSDKEEVEKGTDPNCPPNQQCNVQDLPILTADDVNNTSTISLEQPLVITDSSDSNNLEMLLSGQINATQLRALLLDSGADANMLKQLSDEELMQTYQEMLNEQNNINQ